MQPLTDDEARSEYRLPDSRLISGTSLNTADAWTYARQEHAADSDVEKVRSNFERAARFYLALLRPLLPERRDAPILDLPCGEGQMVFALRQLGYTNLKGYDLDRARLATGTQMGLPLFEGDVFAVLSEQPDASVGCILAMDFLEHLEKPQAIEFLRLVERKLASQGRIIVRTPCADSPQGPTHIFNDFTHKWAATSGVLHRLLLGSGFKSPHVFGEHPRLGMRFGLARVIMFGVATRVVNCAIRCLNMSPYRVWSGSMWGVGYKA
jgi:SAM-dependent methyltransferase